MVWSRGKIANPKNAKVNRNSYDGGTRKRGSTRKRQRCDVEGDLNTMEMKDRLAVVRDYQ